LKRSKSTIASTCIIMLHFLSLTVGPPTRKQKRMLYALGPDAFKPVEIIVAGFPPHTYLVQHATIDGVEYLKSVKPYQSHEFEIIFGFGCDCNDFVEGKVVVVRETSCRW